MGLSAVFPGPLESRQILSIKKTLYVTGSENFMTLTPELSPRIHPKVHSESVLSELGISKNTYYADVKFLGITIHKDEKRKAFITQEDFNLLIELRKHIEKTGTRQGFEAQKGGLVVSEKSELTNTNPAEITSTNNQIDYPQPEEPIATDEMGQQLFRAGAELKAKETAMPHLVIRAVADQLHEEQLPEDLKEKVEATKEAANPKWNPGDLADSLIRRYAAG